jgi:hypothetical protein
MRDVDRCSLRALQEKREREFFVPFFFFLNTKKHFRFHIALGLGYRINKGEMGGGGLSYFRKSYKKKKIIICKSDANDDAGAPPK